MMNNPKDAFYKDIYIPTLIGDFNRILNKENMEVISYIKDNEDDKLYLFVSNITKDIQGTIIAYSQGLDSRYDWITEEKIVRFYHLPFMKRFFYESIRQEIAPYDENENLMYRHIHPRYQ